MKDHNRQIWPHVVPPPKSPMILDNLGIVISMESLRGWPDYRAAHEKLFGTNWFSRFWSGRVYPLIRPKSYLMRKQRFGAEQARMRQQFLDAVLENRPAEPEMQNGT